MSQINHFIFLEQSYDESRTRNGPYRTRVKDKPIKGCGSDADLLRKIATLRSDAAALLPAQPNERIVYHCQKGRLAPADEAGRADR